MCNFCKTPPASRGNDRAPTIPTLSSHHREPWPPTTPGTSGPQGPGRSLGTERAPVLGRHGEQEPEEEDTDREPQDRPVVGTAHTGQRTGLGRAP